MISSLLGKKIGMTQVYDAQNVLIPVTVVEAGPCAILQVKTVARRPARHPYARPHVSHPHWPKTHLSQQGVRTPVTD